MAAPKKPRIRKTAPTVRQRVELATLKAEAPAKPKRLKPALARATSPLRKVPKIKFPQNKFFRGLKKALSIFIPRYFINSYREVRQVTWPSRGDTLRLTGAVFIFASIFGAMVAGVDKVLDIIFKNLVLK